MKTSCILTKRYCTLPHFERDFKMLRLPLSKLMLKPLVKENEFVPS